MAVFLLVDRDARRALATPGPLVAAVVARAVMAPHLVWLVANDFLPFAYASARASPSRGVIDHLWQPAKFAASQLLFLVPALAIAAPLRLPPAAGNDAKVDACDRRIVTVLTFGPLATVLLLSVLSGRGVIAMWGYPLWLFAGLWMVIEAGAAIDRARLSRILVLWAVVFAGLALAFILSYAVLPRLDHRYRAVFFPGDRLAAEITQRFRAATGKPLAYVIATMWVGGNVAHYSPDRPRVLIDGNPRRAPWIDLADMRRRGAVVVWTDADAKGIPPLLRDAVAGAQIEPGFALPMRRGDGVVHVGWAILRPQE